MAGRGIDSIAPGDVAGRGDDEAAVGAYLDTIKRKVGTLPTRADQLKAIRDLRNGGAVEGAAEDETSPTGYRHSDGRFARGQ